MNNLFSRFVSDESGVTAIEYGLIAALIAVVIIGAVSNSRHETVEHVQHRFGFALRLLCCRLQQQKQEPSGRRRAAASFP